MPPHDPALHDPVPGQLALPGLPPADGQLLLPGFAGVAAPTARSSHRGTPLAAPPSAATIARFRSKVVPTPGCHFFVGAVSNPDGYGRINFLDGGVQRTIGAHRFALILAHGDLGPDVVAEHECNETLCVRVGDGHLKLGTQAGNLAYAVATGRHLGPTPAYADPRGRYGRALAIRDALAHGYAPHRLHAALAGTDTTGAAPPTLF